MAKGLKKSGDGVRRKEKAPPAKKAASILVNSAKSTKAPHSVRPRTASKIVVRQAPSGNFEVLDGGTSRTIIKPKSKSVLGEDNIWAAVIAMSDGVAKTRKSSR